MNGGFFCTQTPSQSEFMEVNLWNFSIVQLILCRPSLWASVERFAYITYISYGELYFTGSKDDFVDMFRIVKGGIEELSDDLKNKAAGIRTFPTGFEALMKTEDISGFPNCRYCRSILICTLYRVPDSGILQVRLNQRTGIYVYSSGRFFGDFTSSL